MIAATERWEGGPALRVTRWYDASPESVFRAFTDPVLLREWWGPKGFTFEDLDFPVAVGASYRVRLRAPDGTPFAHEGIFLQVDPPTALSYTWRWTEGPLDPAETLVELNFTAERGGVTVALCHSRFANQDECDRHVGWFDSLERLSRWLVDRPAHSRPSGSAG